MPRWTRRRALIGLSMLALGLPARAQRDTAERIAASQPDDIAAAGVQTFLIGDGLAGDPWRIQWAPPVGTAHAAPCPVLYLLDGNATFPIAWQARERLAGDLGRVALVGIGHPGSARIDITRRTADFTHPKARAVFLELLTGRLREEIDRRVDVDAARTGLFGHSLGGLFALHAMFMRHDRFTRYVVADPSYWWNAGELLDEQAEFIARAHRRPPAPVTLLMEQSSELRTATRKYTGIVADEQIPAEALPFTCLSNARLLQALPFLDVRYRRLPHHTHGSMLADCVENALRLVADA